MEHATTNFLENIHPTTFYGWFPPLYQSFLCGRTAENSSFDYVSVLLRGSAVSRFIIVPVSVGF